MYGVALDRGPAFGYFLWMVCAFGLMAYADRRARFSTHLLVLLCIVGFCHLAGGNLELSGEPLYRQVWFGFVRYDLVVHFFGLGGAGLAVWEATRRMLSADRGMRAALVVVLGASTIGTFVEIAWRPEPCWPKS